MRAGRSGPCLAVVLATALFGCATGISREELLKQMQEGKQPLIVDVRTQGEFERAHLPGAVHIPFYSLASGLKQKMHPEKEPLVLYCEHGPRAGLGSFFLYLAGYDRIFSLEGQMKGWRQNRYPVEHVGE